MKKSWCVLELSCGALLLAAMVQGCGGSSSSSPIPLAQLPDRFASEVCDNIAGCCNAATFPFDAATCKANAKAYLQDAIAQQDSTKLHYDASAAGACMDAYGDFVRSCKTQQSEAINTACNRVFVGQVAAGGACTSSNECALPAGGSVRCSSDPSGSTSEVCIVDSATVPASAPHGKQGQACAGTCSSDSCGSFPSGSGTTTTALCYTSEGLFCADQATCQPLLADGQPCGFDSCRQTSFCDTTCKPKKPDGSPCGGSEECVSDRCSFANQTGAPTTGTCGAANLATAQTCAGNLE